MAPPSGINDDAQNVEYLTHVLMTAKEFDPNFAAAAASYGVNGSSNAQKKFKAIIERSGKYQCKSNVISLKAAADTGAVTAGDDNTPATPTPQSKAPKKRAAPPTAGGSHKVKKAAEGDDTKTAGDDGQAE